MDIKRLEDHVKRHPADYQSVISLYKQRSKLIEKSIKQGQYERLRKISEARHEEHTK